MMDGARLAVPPPPVPRFSLVSREGTVTVTAVITRCYFHHWAAAKVASAVTVKINLAQKYACANFHLSPLNYVFVSESIQVDKIRVFSPSGDLSVTTSKKKSFRFKHFRFF